MGSEQPLAAPAHAYDSPRISPDGQRVAVDITKQETQLWLYDLSRDTLTRLTFEGNANQYPAWTPDGKRIAFQSNKEGAAKHFLANGRRQWRAGAVDHQRVPPYSAFLVPGWTIDGLYAKSIPLRGMTSGCCGWATARPSLSSEHRSAKVRHGFPPTGDGWPISRMNPATMRFTCSPIRARQKVANLDGRWHRAGVESQWAGAVLS